jgi:hypothetical protein
MSPKTVAQVPSNEKANYDGPSNYEYISKPFELNTEQPKAEDWLPVQSDLPKA